MAAIYGVTDQGFVLKRLSDILTDMTTALSAIQDPVTGEYVNLVDENDPFVQMMNATADQIATCWEQLQLCYNQFDPMNASGAGLAGLVQLNGLFKQLNETDTALRLRRQQQTSATSSRQVDAIYAAVVGVPDVNYCRVYVNNTLIADSRGLPGKSIAVVVVGGDDEAIANAIFNVAPADAELYGSTTVNIVDSMGSVYAVAFSRPTEVPITVAVTTTITDTTAWPSNGDTAIKTNIVNFAIYGLSPYIGIPPGKSVYFTQLYTPANAVPGHDVQSIAIARTGAPAAANVTIDWNEVATFDQANITVTHV